MTTNQKPPRFRWDHPSDWLNEKIDEYTAAGNVIELRSLLTSILSTLAEDDVQGVFQSEMEADEYFRDLNLCPDCNSPLTDRTMQNGFPSYCDDCDREVEMEA